ncbi:ABC transporter ATP-binding protein [Trichlorobacter lovleyi]|uniref:ABC transporter related n=1 Tax=Trichlorobacter lovleyi (strain ATCC BAA-1151 / DSM 17278 / SZ) TaxID=398767 RepID=B3EBC7_TRIL1|nr:ATP-binding cassette domain-containing protein [Trichlorobacter lovleyi]ACD95521.1 ABC transporter related [Trichlorobacter lovleyi SZ]
MSALPPEPASVPLLQLEQIATARKGPQGQITPFLTGITCSCQAAALTALIGPSGGGKSSLIRLINRLEEPQQGRILLAGTDINEIPPPLLRQRVGMMLQKAHMFQGSVLDNLQQPFRYRKTALPGADDPHLLQCLSLARLSPDYLQRDARTLSGGEQQRVNLARALINRPEVLLLDEPTSALDRPTTDSLGQTLLEICRSERLAVIMVTHDLRLARRISDQTIYLEAGRIVEAGRTAELFHSPQSKALQGFLAEPAEEQ